MLDVLPADVILIVLSYLPIPSLFSLLVLSRQWFDFFTTNQSPIFRTAALLHEYIQPGTLSLEDALSVNTGRPWAASTGWKDFCHRTIQLRKNWEGKGRVVARVLSPPGPVVYRIKVDERAGICITTHEGGGLCVTHLFSSTVLWRLPQSYVRSTARCEYDNGYLVFDRRSGEMEVWRLASDFSAEGEVATHSPPGHEQMDASARAATMYHQYAPRGQFRPWALLAPPHFTCAYRLVYPTLICAKFNEVSLHDVRTGSLVQTLRAYVPDICYVDVNERHAFACGSTAVNVLSRESGRVILWVNADATPWHRNGILLVEPPPFDKFITPLSVSPSVEKNHSKFIAAHVSKDGRDLVIMSLERRVVFIQDFERICRGETSIKRAGLSLNIRRTQDQCRYLGFEHGRVCVATIQGFYIFSFGPNLSVKVVFVRPSYNTSAKSVPMYRGCMQLTDRRIYFTWKDASRRDDIPLFEDAENAEELPPPITPTLDPELALCERSSRINSVGCIDFSLMPKEI